MIPQKIQALFDFIDFLDVNKKEYIEKYIPLCNELSELDKQRSKLKPNENYKDKQSYECIQKEIKEKFEPITDNIYKPVINKLRELGIWSGDDVYTSIWNNNVSEIEDFKRNFTQEDLEQVFYYKQKYLLFRTETNNDFLCLSFVFSNLDEIYKILFDFFKDTQENEFDSFETKTIEVGDFGEIAKNLKDNIGKNVKYSIPNETFFGNKQGTPTKERLEAKNHFNFFNMGDKIEVGNISNNKGQITLGKDNKTEVNSSDEIAKKIISLAKTRHNHSNCYRNYRIGYSLPINEKLTLAKSDSTKNRIATAHNRRLAKKRVQWLNEALCFVSSSVLADSLVLRNPLLRQAPNRYVQL